jgi:guanylate kinase
VGRKCRDNFYGTLKQWNGIWAKGKCHFDIDVSGGLRRNRNSNKRNVNVFVKPPSIDW